MTESPIRAILRQVPIVPVIALDDDALAAPLAEALADGGLPCAEVTFRTSAAVGAIRAMSQRPDFMVGAGTVISIDQLDAAIDAGARFIVSPGLDPELVNACRQRAVPVLPGAATASEIQAALRLGLDTVKFFPAQAMGGLATIKALAAPFPTLRFVPTGGVSTDNLADYLSEPSVLAVGGSWMAASDLIRAHDWAGITDRVVRGLEIARQGLTR